VSDDGTIRLWDPASGNLLNTIDAHRNLINYFALSPDGQWLVSVSSDKKIKVFQMPAMTFVAEAGNTRNSGASVAFLPGDNHRFLVGDWSGWLYLFEGDGPNWKLAQDFRIADREIYTVCSAHNAWWASVFRGDQSGLWKVPGLDLKSAVRVQQVPSYYCTTTNDGQLSAIVFPQGVQLRSNLDGRAWPAVQFAMAAGSPVAIQTQQHMLVVGLEMATLSRGRSRRLLPHPASDNLAPRRWVAGGSLNHLLLLLLRVFASPREGARFAVKLSFSSRPGNLWHAPAAY